MNKQNFEILDILQKKLATAQSDTFSTFAVSNQMLFRFEPLLYFLLSLSCTQSHTHTRTQIDTLKRTQMYPHIDYERVKGREGKIEREWEIIFQICNVGHLKSKIFSASFVVVDVVVVVVVVVAGDKKKHQFLGFWPFECNINWCHVFRLLFLTFFKITESLEH